ncbi:sensor histidine kinase [Branchiibius sp. NY16-3462-2]|uniref:sensor histidine kinase n=1 Tax=Branchiibius sp. NY16-3462-2 TaxID=1807500 RepID=UPI000798357E|nr:sensor histidine kinase [Branchiibius sp. NY16-3462-2]KYH44681.1 histidine kinase [Branchiibius sp. NY16-3462-2]
MSGTPGVWRRPREWSVAAQVFTVTALFAALVLAAGLAGAYLLASRDAEHEASARALAVARTIAATPAVQQAVVGDDPRATLQPYAEDVRRSSDTDFVVIMSPTGIRYTHPDPTRIGKPFLGHIEAAAQGGVVLEDYSGTLGPSVRAVVPVKVDGQVRALVAVGIGRAAAGERVREQLPAILLAGLGMTLVCGLVVGWLTRRLRRQTHGLGERQLREMYEYYDAVLHAISEGLLITDLDHRVRIYNDQAAQLLDLPAAARDRDVRRLGLPAPLAEALSGEGTREDELFVTAARVVVLSSAPARWNGRTLGYVATLRDRTDLESLTGELDSARGLTEALRSQAHESANRLHTIVSLIELGETDQALTFATEELQVSQRLTDSVVAGVHEPALSALLLGKAAEANERGITLQVGENVFVPRDIASARDLVTIVGNLIDNALDAVGSAEHTGERIVGFDAEVDGDAVVLEVWDNGPGLPEGAEQRVFERGWSTKDEGSAGRRGIGLALVSQTVTRLGGTLEVDGPPGARFTVTLPGAVRPVTTPAEVTAP